jgi:hypothetical protein
MLTMKTILLAAALTMLLSPAAYSVDGSAEDLIARSRAQLETQDAVLVHDEVDAYLVVAARDRSLEGTTVYLKHILSGPDGQGQVFLYYKPGAAKAAIKSASGALSADFSQEETWVLRQHFGHRGPKPRVAARVNLATRAAHKS